MPDYSLGRAHGKIQIEYDGSGAGKAARDIDKVAAESDKMDKSLSRSQRTLKDTEREFDRAGDSADHYSRRVHDVDDAHTHLHGSHTRTNRDLEDFSANADRAEDSAAGVSKALHGVSDVLALVGGKFDGVSEGLDAVAGGFSHVGGAASKSSEHVRDFVAHIANFEKSVAKISGMTLGGGALGGLLGLAGGAGVQGIVSMGDAVRQLSGTLALLPSIAAGVGFSMGTLKIAFHGVGSALKDMMADDPKKFLEDIKNMGPVAAQSMLQIAQFRNAFKLAGASIQDSFFKQIINDIQPLIATWLPAVTQAMSQVSGLFGQMAHQFAGILMQPATMQLFKDFIANMSNGLKALMPAIAPLTNIFAQLTVVGSSFFGQIGQDITRILDFFNQLIQKAEASGSLQKWIQSGIDAFNHLINIVYYVGSAFNTIFDAAEKFGGGGFLQWLEKVTGQFDAWTKSAGGQNTLSTFFQTTQQAMQLFAPMIKPIADGIGAIFGAFTKLGVGIAPGWQSFFNIFAGVMKQIGPDIVNTAPALNQFLKGLANSFAALAANIGPNLPNIFAGLSNAFTALLPQLGPLVQAFLQLVTNVGPMLPQFFQQVTGLIQALLPYFPTLIGFVRDFVSAIGGILQAGGGVINFFTTWGSKIAAFAGQIPGLLGGIGDAIKGFFTKLPGEAEQWGKDLINGFINGIKSVAGNVADVVKKITDHIPAVVKHALGIHSPSTVFHEIGVNTMLGLQQGLVAAAQPVISQTLKVAQQVTGAMNTGLTGSSAGGAPAPGGRGASEGRALLPDRIANADTSVLDTYLNHQFDDKRGLKGLAADLGNGLKAMQDGFNLINQYVVSSLFTAMSLSPGANKQQWQRTVSDQKLAEQEQQKLQKQAIQNANKPQQPTWQNVFPGIAGAQPGANPAAAVPAPASNSRDDLAKMVIAAGRAQGLSDDEIKGILATGQVESGLKPEGFLGFTQGQAATPQIATQQFLSNFAKRSAGQDIGVNPQGQVTDWNKYMTFLRVKMQGQNGVVDWQGNQQPSAQDFQNRLFKAMDQLTPSFQNWFSGTQPGFGSVAGQPGALPLLGQAPPTGGPPPTPSAPGAGGQLVVVPPNSGIKVGADGSLAFPPGTQAPVATPRGGSVAENPASRALQVPNAPNVEAGIKAIGGLPTLYPTSGAGAYQVPQWTQALAGMFGLTASTYSSGGSLHQMGYAFDFNGPSQGREALAKFISQNLSAQTLQLIYRGAQDYADCASN